MAHIYHFKMPDVRRVVNEYMRDEKYKCTDGRIDPERTKNNYLMDDSPKGAGFNKVKPRRVNTFMIALKSRVEAIPHVERKDLRVMSDWVITCPRELLDKPEDVKRFFEVSYDFCLKRYGSENVIQGFVHMDEKTPHMHVPIVPQSEDNRISSKKAFPKAELQAFHRELDAVIAKEFGQKGLILNGKTVSKNIDEETGKKNWKAHLKPAELKKYTALKERMEQTIEDYEKQKTELSQEKKQLDFEKGYHRHIEKELKAKEKKLEEDRKEFEDALNAFKDDLREFKHERDKCTDEMIKLILEARKCVYELSEEVERQKAEQERQRVERLNKRAEDAKNRYNDMLKLYGNKLDDYQMGS